MAIELNPISNPSNVGLLNNNLQKIEDEFNDNVLRRDGVAPGEANHMRVPLDMNGNPILNTETDLSNPRSLVNLQDADFRYVNSDGDTMSGVLNMANNFVRSLPAPVQDGDAARKSYVDSGDAAQKQYTDVGLAAKVHKSGDTMSGNLNMSGNNLDNVGTTDTKSLFIGGYPIKPDTGLTAPYVIYVDTIADLQALPTSELVDGQQVRVPGQGLFAYDSVSGSFRHALSYRSEEGIKDYVAATNAMLSFDKMFARKSDGMLKISLTQAPDVSARITEYQFKTDVDGLLLLNRIVVGESQGRAQTEHYLEVGDTSGDWTSTTAGVWYTTIVGSWFSKSVSACDSISLRLYCESRGGLWEVEVLGNDGFSQVSRVSVQADSSGYKDITLGRNLKRQPYTVRATFLGADPFNPPSATPARGWTTSETNAILTVVDSANAGRINAETEKTVMKSSIQEFAILARRDGDTTDRSFVPAHSSSPGATDSITERTYITGTVEYDGTPLSGNSWQGLPDYPVECDGLTVTQQYTARNVLNPVDALWIGYLTQSFTRGGMQVNHRIVFLQDVDLAGSYLFQFASDWMNCPLLKVSGQPERVYESDGTYPSRIMRAGDSALRYGGEFLAGQPMIYAATVDSKVNSNNAVKHYARRMDESALLTDRADGVTKLYHYALRSGNVAPAGDEWCVSMRYTAGIVRSPMSIRGTGVGIA